MQDTGRIRDALAAIVPGYEQIAEIDKNKQEFQVGGRTFHQANFPTYNGRANSSTHQLPEIQGQGERELRLMTIRSEGAVQHRRLRRLRPLPRRRTPRRHSACILTTFAGCGVDLGMTVAVHGLAGTLRRRADCIRSSEIRPGNAAMYYPEANVLVSRHLDPFEQDAGV